MWTDANSNHMFCGLRNLNITWTGSTVYWHEGELQPCVCWSVTASRPGSHQSVPQNLHVEFPVRKLQLYKSSTIIGVVIQLLNKDSAEMGLRPQHCFSLWIFLAINWKLLALNTYFPYLLLGFYTLTLFYRDWAVDCLWCSHLLIAAHYKLSFLCSFPLNLLCLFCWCACARTCVTPQHPILWPH